MKIYRTISPLRKEINALKNKKRVIGFVPTMGYLHEAHLSLVSRARKDSDYVVVSIFVNPVQFGPNEDFKEYPRDLKKDMTLCRRSGVDMVFVPGVRSIYPEGFSTYVNVEGLTERLCGAKRPGHFRGVTTVVAKLFNIISPDIAYFGQKDAQQAIVIKRMVKDMDMPVKIKVMPIVREKDGLAMSSRNKYLDMPSRRQAVSLYKSLRAATELYRKGERDSKKIISGIRDLILREKDTEIDYIAIVDPETLVDVERISGKTLVALAVRVGKTRLIDNVILN